MDFELKVFIDVFGLVTLCEEFKSKEKDPIMKSMEEDHFNGLLETLFREEYNYGDTYPELESGVYLAKFEYDADFDQDGYCDPFVTIGKLIKD